MKKTLTFFLSSILLLSISFSQVVINEIMFNPYYETTPGDVSTYSTDDDGEFVELFNAGQSDVDMSGYQFVQGFDYTFPNGTTIGAGKYLVVARSKERFKADHGTDADLEWGPGSGNGALSNSGEDIVIVTASGDTVDVVDYDDEGDWGAKSSGSPPTAAGASADGLGPSLELKDFAADNSNPANWGIVTGKKGTPGAVNGNFSGTPWSSTGSGGGSGGGGSTGGGSGAGPVRTHSAGTWAGDTAPMINLSLIHI